MLDTKLKKYNQHFIKKAFLLFIIFSFLLLIFLFFSGVLLKNSNIYPVVLDDIKLEIKEGTLGREGAVIVITDLGKQKNVFGEDYIIEKKVFNQWKSLKGKKKWWSLVGYSASADANNKLVMSINWKDHYGKLGRGNYRLLKEINNQYIAVEFTIK